MNTREATIHFCTYLQTIPLTLFDEHYKFALLDNDFNFRKIKVGHQFTNELLLLIELVPRGDNKFYAHFRFKNWREQEMLTIEIYIRDIYGEELEFYIINTFGKLRNTNINPATITP